jgi:hypothetical protein
MLFIEKYSVIEGASCLVSSTVFEIHVHKKVAGCLQISRNIPDTSDSVVP